MRWKFVFVAIWLLISSFFDHFNIAQAQDGFDGSTAATLETKQNCRKGAAIQKNKHSHHLHFHKGKSQGSNKAGKLSAGSQIELSEEGGFMYRHVVYRVDVDKLSNEDRQQLTEAIFNTQLMKKPNFRNTNPSAADVIAYTFSLAAGVKTHTATFDDTTLTPEYRALLQLLHRIGEKTSVKPGG
jgi:hypothetical protein